MISVFSKDTSCLQTNVGETEGVNHE